MPSHRFARAGLSHAPQKEHATQQALATSRGYGRWLVALGLMLSCDTSPAPGDSLPQPMLGPDEIPLQIDMRCPGDANCPDTGDDQLYVGYAGRDVTPEIEPFVDDNKNGVWDRGEAFTDRNNNGVFDAYWIAGYSSGRLATGVADPIWARALALRQNQTTVVLVSVDTCGLFRDESLAIEKRLDARLGIDLFLLHATHNHEAPDLTGGWGPDPFTYGVHEGYRALVHDRILEAVTEAVQGIKPARVSLSSVRVQDPDGSMLRYVNDSRQPTVIDNRLHTLQFIEIGDAIPPRSIATLVNWANHPEAAGSKNPLLTSDFVHTVRETIEKNGGGPAVYISGALGGLLGPGRAEPLDEKGVPIKEGGLPKARALGQEVSRFALQALADPKATSVAGKAARLSFRTARFTAHVDNIKYHFASMLKIFRRSFCCFDESRPLSDDNVPQVETRVAYLQLGPAAIVTNPGELAPELFLGGYDGSARGTYPLLNPSEPNGPDLSRAPAPPYLIDHMDGLREHRMVFGLTMDFLGYILPRYNFVLHETKPYFDDAPGDHYEETNSLGPRAEAEIVGTLRQLVLAK